MGFEYDRSKSEANLEKHGIDFEAAKALWLDPMVLVVPARTRDEPRFLTIGVIGGKHWAAVWTPRHGHVRFISVRRARKEEVDRYESD